MLEILEMLEMLAGRKVQISNFKFEMQAKTSGQAWQARVVGLMGLGDV